MATPLPFGLRDIKVIPYTDATATTLGSELIDLPYARTLSFSETEEFEDLRGDDRLVASHGNGAMVEWEIESGGLSFEAVSAMFGLNIVETGTGPTAVTKMRKSYGDQRPYFRLVGQSISDSGGDVMCTIFRAKANDTFEGEFNDGEFFLTSGSGIGFDSNVEADEGAIYEFWQRGTSSPLTTMPDWSWETEGGV